MNIAVFTYIAALVAANLLVAWLGPWFSIVNSFLLIGLDLSLRDKLHDAWQGKYLALKLAMLIVVAGLISWILNPASGLIALASMVAFTSAMTADSLAYQALRGKSWFIRSNGSNVAGALADSVLFPTIAFSSFMPQIVAMQFASKLAGGFLWSALLRK